MKNNKSQPFRLKSGGLIDREKPISFKFNGQKYWGYEGDTVASALLANGVKLVARSFKYHRPRGIVGIGSEEPNALLQVGSGADTTPNLRATEVDLIEGLVVESVNCWPSVNLDIGSINNKLARFLPPGFYYKTFMWPRKMWKIYERLIRKAAGLGKCPDEVDPDRYGRFNTHCDVLIVGGGPTGIAAALEAGRTGARVILAHEGSEMGGSLSYSQQTIDGRPAKDWVNQREDELRGMEEVRLLVNSTVFGYYDHNFLTINQQCKSGGPENNFYQPKQRVWRVRAGQVVIATGAIERFLIFPNNDRPGVMLASAVSGYINRFAVTPGRKAVVFTNNDNAYWTALHLVNAGSKVEAIIDVRSNPKGPLQLKAQELGIKVLTSHAIVEVKGANKVSGVEVMALDGGGDKVEGPVTSIACDLIAASGGWNPTVHLHSQSGGGLEYNSILGAFVPVDFVQQEKTAGACNGTFDLQGCLREGSEAGMKAANAVGFSSLLTAMTIPVTGDLSELPSSTMWLVPSRKALSREHKQFVDLQEDVTAADIVLAAREGYDSVPLLNRYTTLGFGTEQGKLGNVTGMGILADYLGVKIDSLGTITFRQPYTPVTFGAIAGMDSGELFDPVRKTSIHTWHVAQGAVFENVGQWKRPWYYPRGMESMDDAVNRECVAARTKVALLDQSTLGKIDVRGPDSAEFLNRVYTNNWLKLDKCKARYGIMLSEDGMVMDDGVSGRLESNHFHMFTTTGGAANVMSWLEQWLQTEWPDLKVYLTSVTDQWATMSVVGPRARDTITKICNDIDFSRDSFPFLSFREGTVAGVPGRIFRISFSGELTYEINVPANYGLYVWLAVMSAGKEFGITPYGTEAMHVLRAEKAFIIAGQDTDGTVTPIDLGLDWIISKRKDFLGKRSLSRPDIVKTGRKQLVGLRTRSSQEVLPDGSQILSKPIKSFPKKMIGHVTSTYYSQTLSSSIAMALVEDGRAKMDEEVYIPLSNGNFVTAVITDPVFYDPESERQNV